LVETGQRGSAKKLKNREEAKKNNATPQAIRFDLCVFCEMTDFLKFYYDVKT